MDIGLYLFRIYARCKDEKRGEFGKELLMMIKENENYEENSNDLWYLLISKLLTYRNMMIKLQLKWILIFLMIYAIVDGRREYKNLI